MPQLYTGALMHPLFVDLDDLDALTERERFTNIFRHLHAQEAFLKVTKIMVEQQSQNTQPKKVSIGFRERN